MDKKNDSLPDRREFLRTCGCALAGVAIVGIAPAIGGCEFSHVNGVGGSVDTGRTIDVDVSPLVADGTGLKTTQRGPDGMPIIVIRQSATVFKAMSSSCSHSQFPVNLPNGGRMLCTGHQSHFDLDGVPIDGDAVLTGPLRQYTSTYDAATKVLTINL